MAFLNFEKHKQHMKKGTLLVAIATLIGASATQAVTPVNGNRHAQKVMPQTRRITQSPASQSSAVNSRWYDYSAMAEAVAGGQSTSGLTYLFPDSSIIAEFGAGDYSNPFVHKVSTLLDPLSARLNDPGYFTGQMKIRTTTSFTVDSIEYVFAYQRVDSNSVDTLIFEVGINATSGQSPLYYFPGTSNFGPNVDTAFFRSVPYVYTTNMVGAYGTKRTYKVVLNAAFAADTIPGGFNVARIACTGLPASQTGNRYPMCAVTFKPGYTWPVGPNNEPIDTLNNRNHVLLTALQENGASTYPTYVERDYNMGYIMPTDVRYNLDPNWNGDFIPSIAYTAPFGLETHPFRWKLTANNADIVGINNVDKMQGPDVYPNPNSGSFFVENNNYQTIRVVDALGNVVMEKMPAGQSRLMIDLQGMANGMYFIQATGVNGLSITKVIKQ